MILLRPAGKMSSIMKNCKILIFLSIEFRVIRILFTKNENVKDKKVKNYLKTVKFILAKESTNEDEC
jgi:Holliday junction resolvase-like predicted endonuclease